MAGNRPAEVFGYPSWNTSEEATQIRARSWCPFVDGICNKKSRLLDYPFGVCTVETHNQICSVCPRRFEERGSIEGIPRVLEDVALHYFGDFHNVIPFAEVRLPGVGSIDYVLVRHKPMRAEVDDFVTVEFQSDSTTSTGGLVQGLRDFVAGVDVQQQSYHFGMNTYDTIKRAMTQLLNKGLVYEVWEMKCYWVIQEYIYTNLINRYGFKADGYSSGDASRFALYNLVSQGDYLTLTPQRFVSTTVDEVYQAMKQARAFVDKDQFIRVLNTKLQARLSVRFE